ncbi:MAG: hypothetical protein U5R31_10750 [Acidimicrobiia bacterium]|nr:hypothetical protein [Acidimicrobiia bacterium]
MLAVQVDESPTDLGQGRGRRQPTVDVGTGPAVGGDDAPQHDLLVAVDEAALHHRFRGTGPHHRRLGAPADEEVDGLDHHRLARARLAGERGHAGREHEGQLLDHAQVPDGEL